MNSQTPLNGAQQTHRCPRSSEAASAPQSLTSVLTELAHKTGQSADLTSFHLREQALEDAFSALLARDDAEFDAAMARFDEASA